MGIQDLEDQRKSRKEAVEDMVDLGSEITINKCQKQLLLSTYLINLGAITKIIVPEAPTSPI